MFHSKLGTMNSEARIIYMEVYFVDMNNQIYDWEDTQIEVRNGPAPYYETRVLRVLYQDEWRDCIEVEGVIDVDELDHEPIYDCEPWVVRLV